MRVKCAEAILNRATPFGKAAGVRLDAGATALRIEIVDPVAEAMILKPCTEE